MNYETIAKTFVFSYMLTIPFIQHCFHLQPNYVIFNVKQRKYFLQTLPYCDSFLERVNDLMAIDFVLPCHFPENIN